MASRASAALPAALALVLASGCCRLRMPSSVPDKLEASVFIGFDRAPSCAVPPDPHAARQVAIGEPLPLWFRVVRADAPAEGLHPHRVGLEVVDATGRRLADPGATITPDAVDTNAKGYNAVPISFVGTRRDEYYVRAVYADKRTYAHSYSAPIFVRRAGSESRPPPPAEAAARPRPTERRSVDAARAIAADVYRACAPGDANLDAPAACNAFAHRVLDEQFGVSDLASLASRPGGFSAEEADRVLSTSACWDRLPAAEASRAVENGDAVVAVSPDAAGAGRLAIVVPGGGTRAPRWEGHDAPRVVAMRKDAPGSWLKCGPCTADEAFGAEPTYFLRRVDLGSTCRFDR